MKFEMGKNRQENSQLIIFWSIYVHMFENTIPKFPSRDSAISKKYEGFRKQ
jgi:hypothetical protein